MTVDSMKFKKRKIPTLDTKEMVPKLTVVLPKDVENKKGWSTAKALKDAIADAFAAAWKAGLKTFSQTFMKIFKEEIEEFVDWNPKKVLLKIKVPIKGLRWITIKKVKLSQLKEWASDE